MGSFKRLMYPPRLDVKCPGSLQRSIDSVHAPQPEVHCLPALCCFDDASCFRGENGLKVNLALRHSGRRLRKG
jgi:hypothetical protein